MSTESETLKKLSLEFFDDVGFASAARPFQIDAYKSWIEEGRHGDMSYLAKQVEKKEDPQKLLPGAKSWIALLTYYDTQEPLSIELTDTFKSQKKGWIARYARGRDYHEEISERHLKLIEKLKVKYPSEEFLNCVDSRAVLERDVASRAGLGWVGKNTCLISKSKGSFVFVSEILTTLDLTPDKPIADHCGTCTQCIDACPTNALLEPYLLDARNCISYWTIESKTTAPPELAQKFGGQFYGCDICQDVCPWNKRARKYNNLPEAKESGLVDPYEILKTSDEDLRAKTRNSAMMRAKPQKLKTNAEILIKNLLENGDG